MKYYHGQPVTVTQRKGGAVTMFPATFVAVRSTEKGDWITVRTLGVDGDGGYDISVRPVNVAPRS